jgi:flagellar motor switch/type III secretory pathway protein FliN
VTMENLEQPKEPEPKGGMASPTPDLWVELLDLPCELSVALSVSGCAVADLLALGSNAVIGSDSREGTSLPIWVNDVMVGRGELEVLGSRRAIRITKLC